MSEAVDSVWYILEKIQKDIDRIDEKQDAHLVASTKLTSQIDSISAKVVEMNKLLTQDNGKPSILSQLSVLSTDVRKTSDAVTETKALVAKLHADISEVQKFVGARTPKEVMVERWKVLGKIGVATLAVLPGILSFFHSFL